MLFVPVVAGALLFVEDESGAGAVPVGLHAARLNASSSINVRKIQNVNFRGAPLNSFFAFVTLLSPLALVSYFAGGAGGSGTFPSAVRTVNSQGFASKWQRLQSTNHALL